MISGEVIRAVKDLINVLDGAERTATEIKDEYTEVYENLPLDAFPKVKIDTGLLLAEAIYLASLVEKTRTLQNIQTYLLTLPQGERRVLYGDFLKACEGRFNRLMKLLSVIDYEMFQLQDKEIKLGEKQLGDKALEVWNGANYRERVKANVNSLGNLLKKEVITAFLLGKTEKQVRNSIIEFLLRVVNYLVGSFVPSLRGFIAKRK